MAKFKIQKGLSDADMMKGFVETETFETAILKDNASTGNKLGAKVSHIKRKMIFIKSF